MREPDVSCTGKKVFASSRDANLAIVQIKKKRTRNREGGVSQLSSYKCHVCGQWHIGKPQSRAARRGW